MPYNDYEFTDHKTALGHLRVLDLTSVQIGYFGKIFADLGADVIKIEPPKGDPVRYMAPFAGHGIKQESSLYFLNFNANKRSIILDLETDDGCESFLKLASTADVIVENFDPAYLEARGVGYHTLKRENPALIFVSITPFGQVGEYAGFQGSELVTQAMGGLLYVQGDDQKPPCYAPCDQASQLSAVHAAYGALAALKVKGQSGRGQRIDVSMQDVVSHVLFSLTQYAFSHEIIRRTGTKATLAPNGYYRCEDGYVSLSIFFPHHWDVMLDWMEIEALRGPIWRNMDFRSSNADIVNQFVSEFISDFTVEEFVREAQVRHLAVSALNTVESFANDEHINARRFFKTSECSGIREYTSAGPPYRFSHTPWNSPRPAPTLGQHTTEVLFEKPRPNNSLPIFDKSTSGKLPLSGVRIVDFGRVWAGPYATRYLGDLGAEVIKIENENFLDNGRISSDARPVFSEINRSKLGVTVDFRNTEGADKIRELVSVSDIVLDNFANGVLDRRGLGYKELRRINPGIIMVSMPGYGNEGPYSNYVAYGQNLMAYAGLSLLWGFADSPIAARPTVHYSDYMSAAHAAFAMMAALEHRSQTGQGQYVELPQAETLASTMGVALLDYFVNDHTWDALGNRSISFAPHGCYPCLGNDQWCAITCLTDQHWRDLCNVMNYPELASNTKFDSLDTRLQNQDALDEIIGKWTQRFTPYQIMWNLQRIGVPAGVVQNGEELYHDIHLRTREFIQHVQHPESRTLEHSGIPVKLSETPGRIIRGLPLLGQHNSYVFRDLLGLGLSDLGPD